MTLGGRRAERIEQQIAEREVAIALSEVGEGILADIDPLNGVLQGQGAFLTVWAS
jgi:hypothetical protein